MSTTGTGLDMQNPKEIAELMEIRKNFIHIFPEEFIRTAFLEAVDSTPFIDFLSVRKRKSFKIKPFSVNMQFDQSKFLELHPDRDFRHHDNKTIEKIRTDIIARDFVSVFIDKLNDGLKTPEIEEAIKIYKLNKKKIGAILSTIMIISMEETDPAERMTVDKLSFNFSLFI